MRDVRGLSDWLRSLHSEQTRAARSPSPGGLLTAPPAAVETTLISQAVVLALEEKVVPIVIR